MGSQESKSTSRFNLTAQNVVDECSKAIDMGRLYVLVTGATSGIGLETARVLACNGAHVYLMGRQEQKVQESVDQINQELKEKSSTGFVEGVVFDLNSLASVKNFADDFNHKQKRLNILILNAGILSIRFAQTVDGLEQVMGVNHIAHAYLTQLLIPSLIANAPSRVVVVSAKLHEGPPLDYEAFQQQSMNTDDAKKSWAILRSYQQSKLANVLYARVLANQYKDQQITAYSLHPGVIRTNLGGNQFLAGLVIMFFKKKSIEQGAATTVFCALQPDLEEHTGRYFDDSTVTDLADKWTDDDLTRFREWTETIIQERTAKN